MSNPYTLVFGQPPIELIERNAQMKRIISEFTAERPSNYLNMITGIRGCGKTVFITNIAKQLSKTEGWIVVNLNPQRDLLKSLASKLSSSQNMSNWFKEAKINLQVLGLGVEIKGEEPVYDIEEALRRMLLTIKKKNKRILITIDDAANSKEMRIFASAYQLFLREELPVFLLLTGLYKSLESLKNADGMTFLERAPRTILAPLNINAMAFNYQNALGIAQDKAMRLAGASRGYSFAFQVLGYFAWEKPHDMPDALSEAREYLYEFAYNKIWSELSTKDREFVIAMANEPMGEVAAIRGRLGYSSNQFNPYRDRLLKAGVVESEQKGVLRFSLPWFDEYAKEKQRSF